METITSKIEFVVSQLGEGNLSRDGTNLAVKCPACGKTSKKKLSICLETWRCHCWVCGLKGKNLYNILKKHNSTDSAREYANRFKINVKDSIKNEPEIKKVKLPKDFMLLASNLKCEDPDFRAVVSYLNRRGVSQEKMWRHKIGTCIAGGYWNRRVVFPSFNSSHELDYYVSRTIDDDIKPKYLNAKADKKDIIFDEMRIDWNRELTIVEGVFDLIKCNDNATCLLGSYLSESHKLFRKIVENNTPVLLALDHDIVHKAHKIAHLLFNYGVSVRIMNTSNIEDVGALSHHEFCKRAEEANNYTCDTKIGFLIDSIRSGSVF